MTCKKKFEYGYYSGTEGQTPIPVFYMGNVISGYFVVLSTAPSGIWSNHVDRALDHLQEFEVVYHPIAGDVESPHNSGCLGIGQFDTKGGQSCFQLLHTHSPIPILVEALENLMMDETRS